MLYKIGLCGAHGTGKTTLAKALSEKLSLKFITRTMRDMWEEFGIDNFEKIPSDVRATFQKYAIAKQISREDTEGGLGFITDRTVLDNWGYSLLGSDLSTIDLQVYQELVKARLHNYTHLIYLPVMFDSKQEKLRANINTRDKWADTIEKYLQKWVSTNKLFRVTEDDFELRLKQVLDFIND